ncbi:UbiA family prenyltransferase [Nitrospirillum pindoramense]|uniref:4-hydroxybenzoate polyprenyltransferase n=1 Tax=Nitrospirillum amazonense TaxID=28077 RepID=A0A560GLT6_9PROT|nr:UbiA family prenyltransferase [Nitrospirillum amazonense]TWB34574.1 4-hydroxybenzoate polyprenyltransferase [Nitrospirillum amazonense]
MGTAPAILIRPRAVLILGRVSNLPTVLSNALAGIILSGGAPEIGPADAARALLALVLFYIGGMYLNDAMDVEIDARERPGRPIPKGDASRAAVFTAGFALLGLGLALAAAAGPRAGVAAGALVGAILLYDWIHKRTAAAPLVMGLCRLLCYGTAAAMAGGRLDAPGLWIGGTGLFCLVVGLTYAARQEAYDRLGAAWPLAVLAMPLIIAIGAALTGQGAVPLALALSLALGLACAAGLRRFFRRAPGDVPRAVALLIAAIALYDAALIAAAGGDVAVVAVAVLCFPLTLILQRVIPGT